ncbi:uncharacterized protein LOC144429935 [Styela clava]
MVFDGLTTCTVRYPYRSNGVRFVPFRKPHIDCQKVMRWIKECNRPHTHSIFNLGKITRNTFVRTKDLSPDTSFDTETCESDESEKGLSGIQPDLPPDSLVETTSSAADEKDSALSDSRKM